MLKPVGTGGHNQLLGSFCIHTGHLDQFVYSQLSQVVTRGMWNRIAGSVGLLTAALIIIGLGEGLAIATGSDAGMLGLFSVLGYVGLTLWLILTGLGLLLVKIDAIATQKLVSNHAAGHAITA